jgi:hypothetical protein
LKRLPAETLKIDRSFVRDILDDPDDLAILEGIMGLAAAFRRTPIAEGVESPAHGELLLQFGCELAQGYCIARPMPAGELPAWLAQWQPDPAWQGRKPLAREDQALLFVGIEHRAWLKALIRYVEGVASAPPAMPENECYFGGWLNAESTAAYRSNPVFDEIIRCHSRIHALAEPLCAMVRQGRRQDAADGLDELRRASAELLSVFKRLLEA